MSKTQDTVPGSKRKLESEKGVGNDNSYTENKFKSRIKRKRIRKLKFKCGDILNANIDSTKGMHICIILNDVNSFGHQTCVPICNLTGSEVVESGEFVIDISKYDLPDSWFKSKKPQSWIRCNVMDCIWSSNYKKAEKLGNIKDDFPELWSEVCEKTRFCTISERLKDVCDCEYEESKNEIDEDSECDCET
jgi:hypothetical protein